MKKMMKYSTYFATKHRPRRGCTRPVSIPMSVESRQQAEKAKMQTFRRVRLIAPRSLWIAMRAIHANPTRRRTRSSVLRMTERLPSRPPPPPAPPSGTSGDSSIEAMRMTSPASACRSVARNSTAAAVATSGTSRGARVSQIDRAKSDPRRPPRSAAFRAGRAPTAPGAAGTLLPLAAGRLGLVAGSGSLPRRPGPAVLRLLVVALVDVLHLRGVRADLRFDVVQDDSADGGVHVVEMRLGPLQYGAADPPELVDQDYAVHPRREDHRVGHGENRRRVDEDDVEPRGHLDDEIGEQGRGQELGGVRWQRSRGEDPEVLQTCGGEHRAHVDAPEEHLREAVQD